LSKTLNSLQFFEHQLDDNPSQVCKAIALGRVRVGPMNTLQTVASAQTFGAKKELLKVATKTT